MLFSAMVFAPMLLSSGLSSYGGRALGQDPTGQDKTVPAKAPMLVAVEGRGVQIYQCEATENGFGWALLAPDAKLYDTSGAEVGTHNAGPRWTWKDGSAVVGTLAQRTPSPDPGSIPWLLLSLLQVGQQDGVLANAGWVRRSDTHGGVAPAAGCDQNQLGKVQRVDYTATYTFYKRALGM
jgi:hypothetical protein